MKKIVMVLSLLVLVSGAMAQQDNKLSKREQRKLEKQKEKEAKLALEKKAHELANALVKDSTFVFVANTLYGERGGTFTIDPTLNFLGVNKEDAVYQFSFRGITGWNGLGGATFEGTVSKYEFNPSENIQKGSKLVMMMQPKGVGGLPYITMTFFGLNATVNITFSNGNRITMDGQIRSIHDAEILKGRPVF